VALDLRTPRLPVVVLAGGSSRRFGSDKLAAPIGGRSALARVVASVSPLASEVFLATAGPPSPKALGASLRRSVRVLRDRPRQWGAGPASAIAAALEGLGTEPTLFVPGDIPWVETAALRKFVARSTASDADVAAPFWGSGETEHLVQWHRSRRNLRFLPWRRPHALPARRASEFLRAVPRTLLIPVRRLTDRPASFAHLTVPRDVHRPVARGDLRGSTRCRVVAGPTKASYRAAQAARSAGRPTAAAIAFADESRRYARAGFSILAWHALDDAMLIAGAVPELARSRRRLEEQFPVLSRRHETVNRSR